MVAFALRLLQPSEEQLLPYRVYFDTRKDELAPLNWSSPQMEAFLHSQFDLRERQYNLNYPASIKEVILCDAVPAGLMTTQTNTDSSLIFCS
jgi:hypothetical protein